MCQVCSLWNKNLLTKSEAQKALIELINTTEDDDFLFHAQEVVIELDKKLKLVKMS